MLRAGGIDQSEPKKKACSPKKKKKSFWRKMAGARWMCACEFRWEGVKGGIEKEIKVSGE